MLNTTLGDIKNHEEMHDKAGGAVGNSCRTRSDIEKSRNNIEKTFLNTYLLSLNVILYGNEFSPQSNTGVSRSSILLISN